ncbi:MAG: hypothetical protein IJ692_03010 [Alloprevotella sp.]|nr:hypothetical protein [Bacteroidaceae bacterium]MBR1652344.1 hypothetical protein [Alloprevotella sp.]
MTREEQEFLERLNNPEAAVERDETTEKERRSLFLRNLLNGTFILLACVAMGFIAYSWFREAPQARLYGIGIGIAAVLLKMVEATMRMTTMLRKPQSPHHRRTKI